MTELPMWWLVISAVFFAVNLVVLIVLAIIGFRALQMLQQLKPKVDELTVKVNRLMDSVNNTAVKVDAIALNVQNTTQTMSSKTSNALGAFEQASLVGAPLLGRVMPALNIALTALKVFQAFRGARGGKRLRK